MSGRTARRRDLRLLPVALTAWAGAGVAIVFPEHAVTIAVALWAGAVAVLAVAVRRARRTALALVAVAIAVAGAAASHVALAQPARAAVADLKITGGRSVTFEVDVVGKVERSATGFRFDAITRSATIGRDVRPVSAPVLVRVQERPEGLDLGARVVVTGTAFHADAADREVLVIEASTIRLARPPTGALAVAAELRTGLVAAVDGLPDPGAGLVPGLAVGDTSAVTADLDQQMKTSSLSHLTAVSGANCEAGDANTTYRSSAHTRLAGPQRAVKRWLTQQPARALPDGRAWQAFGTPSLKSSVSRTTNQTTTIVESNARLDHGADHTLRVKENSRENKREINCVVPLGRNQSNKPTQSRPRADATTQRSSNNHRAQYGT